MIKLIVGFASIEWLNGIIWVTREYVISSLTDLLVITITVISFEM
jgi:hypothetical protein